jgi:hypothetical protein
MMKDLNGPESRSRDMTLQQCADSCDGYDYLALTSGARLQLATQAVYRRLCFCPACSYGRVKYMGL